MKAPKNCNGPHSEGDAASSFSKLSHSSLNLGASFENGNAGIGSRMESALDKSLDSCHRRLRRQAKTAPLLHSKVIHDACASSCTVPVKSCKVLRCDLSRWEHRVPTAGAQAGLLL